MGDQRDGGIAWTDESWNPVRGCSRVSEGCRNCYAERVAARFSGPGRVVGGDGAGGGLRQEKPGPYLGLVRDGKWNGQVRLVPEHLADPLRWRRPRRVFVNSMSDLFHEALSDEDIAAVFGVMAAAPKHTFQVLTKRAKRMREWCAAATRQRGQTPRSWISQCSARILDGRQWNWSGVGIGNPWPLPNVWLGVSVEDQRTADERIPELLATQAAVHWVSYEPALGPIDFRIGTCNTLSSGHDGHLAGRRVGWVVVGGESGPKARPFDLAWARETVRQCREAGVPIFFKQGGATNRCEHDAAGGHLDCCPGELRVREFPR